MDRPDGDQLGFNLSEASDYIEKATEIFDDLYHLVGTRRDEGGSASAQLTSDSFMTLMESLLKPLYGYIYKTAKKLDRNGRPTETATTLLNMMDDVFKAQINPDVASLDSKDLKLTSFLSLLPENWLDGHVIDHLLNIYSQNKKVLVIPFKLVGDLLSDRPKHDLEEFLKFKKLCDCDAIMGAFLKEGRHWNLLYIHKATPTVTTSLVAPCGKEEFESEWTKYASSKVSGIRHLLRLSNKQWTIHVIAHPTQQDSHNCGVITIKIADLLVQDLPSCTTSLEGRFTTDSKELYILRLQYAEKILELEKFRRRVFQEDLS